MNYKAKQRAQEKVIHSSKQGTLEWSSTGGRTYYTGANQIKKANKGMRAKLMRLMEKMQ
mgnify:FL=1|jgi:hypothetical protein